MMLWFFNHNILFVNSDSYKATIFNDDMDPINADQNSVSLLMFLTIMIHYDF